MGKTSKNALGGSVDGLVAFVKKDCPTCELVEPVLGELQAIAAAGGTPITIVTQDDPTFPALDDVVFDEDLSLSWHANVDTVPTLDRMGNGLSADRVVGWSRNEWSALTGIETLGADLPDHRPGCGSLSVDPEHAERLEVHFGESGLVSRRVEFGDLEDHVEAMFDRGWSDGLPLVAPTEVRVQRMLEGTTRSPDDIVCIVPPDLVEVTVEKVAINAVMAGCRPEYLPVVLAGLEAVCTDEFNMHGVLATTMPVGPIFIVNGPIADAIGMNAGINALGHGNRANATIGRAVQLVIRNVGGGAPGGVDQAAHGNPGKLGMCFPEREADSPWGPLSVDRGFASGQNTVTAFAGEAPRILFDQLSRTPESLTASLAESLKATISPRLAMMFDAVLVLCPEHAARYADAGWTKERFLAELHQHLELDADEILRGTNGIAEGIPEEFAGTKLPKFNPDGGLMIVHAGGDAGLFSSVMGGWVNGATGSVPVTKEIIA